MIDLRTELAPLLDAAQRPSLERIRASAARRRRRRIIVRSATTLVVIAAVVGVWIARPASSRSVKTANSVAPGRVECRVTVGDSSVTAAFDLAVHEGATVHIEGSALTFTVVAASRDGVLWMLRVVATGSQTIAPFTATGGYIAGESAFRGGVRTKDGGVLAYGCPLASKPPTVTVPTSNAIAPANGGSLGFVSLKEGWVCGTPMEYTHDGGTSWQPIPVGTDGASQRECAFQPGRAWVAVDTSGALAVPGVVHVIAGAPSRTRWVPLPGARVNESVQSLDFVDALHGWALTATARADHQLGPGTLYGTVDGGVHWQRIATQVPVASGLRLSSATTGWGIADRNLERTDDGGRTWQAMPVVPTPSLASYLVGSFESVFAFGDHVVADGFLPSGNFGQLFTEVSNDGGAHWTLKLVSTDVIEPAGTLTRSFVAVDATHWRYALGNRFVATDDGGRTWRTAPTGPIGQVEGISFATPDIGWETGCGPLSPCAENAETTDGGATWHLPAHP